MDSGAGTTGDPAGCREDVGASCRCAAPAHRFGPPGDPSPSSRRSAAMAVSGAFGQWPIASGRMAMAFGAGVPVPSDAQRFIGTGTGTRAASPIHALNPQRHRALRHRRIQIRALDQVLIPSSRRRQGQRHTLSTVLALAAAATINRYTTEFVGRHNIRDGDTIDTMRGVVAGAVGERLMYRNLIAGWSGIRSTFQQRVQARNSSGSRGWLPSMRKRNANALPRPSSRAMTTRSPMTKIAIQS